MSKENESVSVKIPDSVTKAVKGAGDIAIHAPHLVALILLVGLFLFYLERHNAAEKDEDARMDKLAEVRITTCHNVQERAVEVMDELRESLGAQADEFRDLGNKSEALEKSIEALNQTIIRHEKQMHDGPIDFIPNRREQ